MADHNELTITKPAESNQRPVSPAVDIFEDADGITLLADMPGVSKDLLDIKLDGDNLSIEGGVEMDLPSEMRALWAEVNVPRFRRTFTLSRELDAARIEANLKDGVLTLKVPKQAHAQPRRIEVTAG
ncbi:Hsp20/alpha crystallin family protein [soil metagenome]